MRGLLAVLLLAAAPAGATVNHPFASHPVTYAAGAIRPDHVTQAVLDQAVRDFYDAGKASFLRQTCGPGRYVVLTRTRAGNLTVFATRTRRWKAATRARTPQLDACESPLPGRAACVTTEGPRTTTHEEDPPCNHIPC